MGSPGRCVSLTVPVRHNVPKAPGGQPTASEQPPDEYGGAAPMPRTQASWHRFVREQHRVAAGDAGRGGSDLVGAGSCARGTAGRRPSGVTDPGAVTERDRRRLERWRTTHGPAADDAWFTERLADLDLDPAGLLALLAEPPADLAARTTRPAWAELTEAVIARTGTESGVPDDELTSASGFGLIVAGFVDAAIDQFVELAPGAAPVSDVDIDAQLELLRRFAADRDAIVTALLGAVDPGQLVAVEHCGDLHQGGRSTALLRFAGGAQVAYKPRPLGVHAHFNTIVRWLNGKVAQRYPPGEPAPRGRAMGALGAMRTHACSSPVDGASSDGVDGASGDRVDGASSRSTAGTRSGYASRSSPWPIPAYPVSSPGVPTMPVIDSSRHPPALRRARHVPGCL